MNQGIYEGCTNSWHTLVTPEALSQINDTVTRGLITKWGYRLEKAHFLVDGGFLRTLGCSLKSHHGRRMDSEEPTESL